MANLNVMYRIAADISGLERGVSQAAASTQKLETMATNIGRTLTAAFSVGAVVSFASAIAKDADALTKLSDKTGLTTDALQRFRRVADDAGNTLDQLAQATTQLQNRLAGDDKSVVESLNKLGLTVAQLRAMSPEQQFLAVADALRGVKDQAEFVHLGVALMGRGFMEVIPTIKQGFDDVRNKQIGMSQDAVKAWGDLWDWITKTTRALKDYAGELAAAPFVNTMKLWHSAAQAADVTFHSVDTQLSKMVANVKTIQSAPAGLGPLTMTEPELKKTIRALDDQREKLNKSREAQERLTEQTKRFNEELGRSRDAVRHVEAAWPGVITQFGRADTAETDLYHSTKKLREELDKLTHSGEGYSAAGFLAGIENIGTKFVPSMADLGTKGKTAFSEAVGRLPDVIVGALQGGGNVMNSVGASVGRDIGKAIAKAIGGALGDLAGSLAGAGITAAWTQFMNTLFGGGPGIVGNLERMAIGITDTSDAWKQAAEAAARYGITLSTDVHDAALQMWRDFQLLDAAGVDHNTILEKMAPTMMDYLAKARETGAQVPLELKNIIQSMIDLGLITDATGQPITDLKDLGVDFAQTLDSVIQNELIPALFAVVDAIRGIGNEINNLPRRTDLDIITHHYDESGGIVGGVISNLPESVGAGQSNILPFVGRSSALSRSSGGAMPSAPVSGGKTAIVINVNGGSYDTPAGRQRAARQIADATADALRRQKRIA